MKSQVLFSPEAIQDLARLHRYIQEFGGHDAAQREVARIFVFCNSLSTFPQRGTRRDEIRPGIRTIAVRRRYTIAYDVEGSMVTILRVFGRGQYVAM